MGWLVTLQEKTKILLNLFQIIQTLNLAKWAHIFCIDLFCYFFFFTCLITLCYLTELIVEKLAIAS